MLYAVQSFFDPAAEQAVLLAWQSLAEAGFESLHDTGNRPHLSLAIYEELDVRECERRLQAIAASSAPFPARLESVGFFVSPGAVVFLGPVVTPPLLALHDEVHRQLGDIGKHPLGYYLPGRWVPHCTLAWDFAPERVAEAIQIAGATLPLECGITELGVIEYRPVRHLFAFRLGQER